VTALMSCAVLATSCFTIPATCSAANLCEEAKLNSGILVLRTIVLGQGQRLFSGLRSPVDRRLISATPSALASWQPSTSRHEPSHADDEK
jgi:hypothetical protein